MRYFITIGLLLTAALTVSAQRSPKLLSAIEEARTDSLKIAAYTKVVRHFRFKHQDSALYFANEGLLYARDAGYLIGEGIMINLIGNIHERHGQLDVARNRYLEAQELFADAGYERGVAGTHNGLGVVAGRTGEYDLATRHFLKALKLYEQVEDSAGVVQTYIKLGVVSDHMGNLDQALEYYLKAEALNSGLPSSNASLALLNNIGIVYGKRNDLKMALRYFRKGLSASDPHASTGVHMALLGSLGLAFSKSGIHDSAWFYQQQVLSMARRYNMPEEEARSLVNLALLVKETDPDQSLALLNQALAITGRIRQIMLRSEVYDAMIEVYKSKNDYRQALAITEKTQLIKDSLFNMAKSKEIANLLTTHQLASRENEIRNLALKHEKSIFQRDLMIGVALVAIAIIGIVWFFNTKISRLNALLVRKQTELKDSNTVKDKLFSVLGHDLRAPMAGVIGLLNVLASKHQQHDEKTIIEKLANQAASTLETLDNLLLWGQRQLKGVRLNQETIPARDHVRKSISLSSDYATQKNIELIEKVPSDLLVYADPSHFDFIIRNLVSNALKFSHTGGTVSVNAMPAEGGQVVFSISDSGVGIPPNVQKKIFSGSSDSVKGTWNEKGTGIGLLLAKEYILENGGRLWLESQEGTGSTFYFSLRQRTLPQQQVLFPEKDNF